MTNTSASSDSHVVTLVVEVILSIALLALLVVAAYLGWRHYNMRRSDPDTYRLFGDERSNSISGKSSVC